MIMKRAHLFWRSARFTICTLALLLVGCSKDQSVRTDRLALVDRGERRFAVVDSLHVGNREHEIISGRYSPDGFALFDRVDGRLLVASRGSDSVRAIGRTGSGPGEYRSVVDAAWLDDEVIVVDALQRQLVIFDTTGMVRATQRVDGGVGTILARTEQATVVGGRFMRVDRADTVDAILRLAADGTVTRHVPLPFPTDPSGRRFSDVHVAACGTGQFAAVRADTNVVWIVDASTLTTLRTLTLSVAFAGVSAEPRPNNSLDPERFRFTGVLGGDTGCAIVAPRDLDGDHPVLDLYRIGPDQSTVDQFTVPLRFPVAFRRDTLFALDGETNTQAIRILAAELKR